MLELYENTCNASHNLNRNYVNLMLSMAIKDGESENCVGVITIKADDNVVYTSPELGKTTEPITTSDIPLSNCGLLKIEYSNNGSWNNRCLIFDASVYN